MSPAPSHQAALRSAYNFDRGLSALTLLGDMVMPITSGSAPSGRGHCSAKIYLFSLNKQKPLLFVQSHVPGYVNDYDKLKQAGAEVIACVSVNDAFVMKAWGDSTGATGKASHSLACSSHVVLPLACCGIHTQLWPRQPAGAVCTLSWHATECSHANTSRHAWLNIAACA